MVGIGFSILPDSWSAGAEAARLAAERAGGVDNQAWGIAFCGGRHNPQSILNAIHSELGPVPILGGSVVGVITNDELDYTGFECSLALFPGPRPSVLRQDMRSLGETETGRRLAKELRTLDDPTPSVVLFYDSVRESSPISLYLGSQLMDGLYEELGDTAPDIIGAGLVGDFQFRSSFIFDGDSVKRHMAMGIVLPPWIKMHSIIMHGCYPVSPFLEITQIDGAVVYELDGRPAMDVLLEFLGHDRDPIVSDPLSWVVALGEKHGDPYAPFDETHYVNRIVIDTNPQERTLTLFEADFHVGAKVQVMARDNSTMVESVRGRTRQLLQSIEGLQPFIGTYIDCAGRTCAFSGAEIEEAQILREELGNAVPLLGFYSGVEIAPLLHRSRPLDWTGVLTVLTEEAAS